MDLCPFFFFLQPHDDMLIYGVLYNLLDVSVSYTREYIISLMKIKINIKFSYNILLFTQLKVSCLLLFTQIAN